MVLLVTGGAGFIGSNFVRYWLQTHPADRVINYDKLTYAGNLENLADVAANPNYRFVRGDIADGALLDDVLASEQVDAIIHFAAETHVDRSLINGAEFVRTNVLGTQVLLDAALRNKIARFHHVSTDEIFGAIGEHEERKFDEATPYAPRNPYSASKAASDHLVRAYHQSFGLPITITNCSNNFGPYHFPEKLIPLAITNLIEGKQVPVYGQGKQSRDWLYVVDHCKAIDLVLHNGVIGETYCVGGMHTEITNLEVVRKLCAILGRDPEQSITFVADRPGHDFKYVVDWSKINQELGWAPETDFDHRLEETVRWFQANEAWWRHVKS
ncbi:MAG TPA: dTDP-glucose 4,6-dehydratase, partial [Herpetosiphonaceae bacterium]